jgi:hypothetical protein
LSASQGFLRAFGEEFAVEVIEAEIQPFQRYSPRTRTLVGHRYPGALLDLFSICQ